MILLQTQSHDLNPGLLIFSLLLSVCGAFVCSDKAKKLNRDSTAWGLFGFFLPIVAMIWVNCVKPKVAWNNPDKTPSNNKRESSLAIKNDFNNKID